jgi:hypothetical protein
MRKPPFPAAAASNRPRGVPLTATFLLLVPLAFSEEFTQAIADASGTETPPFAVLAWDTALIVVLSVTVGAVWRKHSPRARPVLKRWWWLGAVLTLAIDFLAGALKAFADIDQAVNMPLWAVVLILLGYLVSLVMLIAGAVAATPYALFRTKLRYRDPPAWSRLQATIPLIVGVAGAWTASVVWDRVLDPRRAEDCHDAIGVINQEYFAQLSQVIPLLLIAIGLEAGIFRSLLSKPSPRAMVVMTVVLLAVAEMLAISALPWSNVGCDRLASWHEYIAFIVTVDACLVALAWLVWALLQRAKPTPSDRAGLGKARSRSGPTRLSR